MQVKPRLRLEERESFAFGKFILYIYKKQNKTQQQSAAVGATVVPARRLCGLRALLPVYLTAVCLAQCKVPMHGCVLSVSTKKDLKKILRR